MDMPRAFSSCWTSRPSISGMRTSSRIQPCSVCLRFLRNSTPETHGVTEKPDFFSMKPVERRIERSEEHTSELQSLMRISYAVFCLKKKIHKEKQRHDKTTTLSRKLRQPQTNKE